MLAHTYPRPAICIAPTATPADISALRKFARQVAYETGRPAVYALDADRNVGEYDAVYVSGDVSALRDAPTLVLVGEGLAFGMDVHEPHAEPVECVCGLVMHYARPDMVNGEVYCNECRSLDACTWCAEPFDVEDAEIVDNGYAFVPLHEGCASGLRTAGLRVVA